MDEKHDIDILNKNNKFYEKSLGLSPADLLIIEIKKPNRPIIPKKGSIYRKNSKKFDKNLVFTNNFDDDHIYKDPKVRI